MVARQCPCEENNQCSGFLPASSCHQVTAIDENGTFIGEILSHFLPTAGFGRSLQWAFTMCFNHQRIGLRTLSDNQIALRFPCFPLVPSHPVALVGTSLSPALCTMASSTGLWDKVERSVRNLVPRWGGMVTIQPCGLWAMGCTHGYMQMVVVYIILF